MTQKIIFLSTEALVTPYVLLFFYFMHASHKFVLIFKSILFLL